MGGGSKETTTKNEPYKGLPDWASWYYEKDQKRGTDLIEDAEGLTDWLSANPEYVASISNQEKKALKGITKQGDKSQRLLSLARKALGGDSYESEFTDDVVDTTLAGMQRQADRERVARGASEAAIGGLTSSRAGVADALSSQLLGMNMAEMEAKLRTDAERFGAEMGLRESGQLESLAGSGMDIADLESKWRGTYGETKRGIGERRATADRNAEKDALSWYTDVFNSTRQLPSSQGGATTTVAPGPSPINQALGTASTVAGIWSAVSDENAKQEIVPDDRSALDRLRSLGLYEYDYRPGVGHTRDRTSGLMAQELEKAGITGAVRTRPDGYREVDAYPVLATVVKAVQELDARSRSGPGLNEAA